MREFDISIRTPPEGCVIVYMLPYQSYLSPEGLRILLDSTIKEKNIKFIRVPNEIALKAHISRAILNVPEKYNNPIEIEAGGVVSDPLWTRDGEDILTRDGVEIESVERIKKLFVSEIKTTKPEPVSIRVDAGGMASGFLQTDDYKDILTRDGEDIIASMIQPDVELFYKRIHETEGSAIEITSQLSDILKHSFENVNGELAISSLLSDIVERSYEMFSNDIQIQSSVDSLTSYDQIAVESDVELDADVEVSMARYRKLFEVDDGTLASIDDMTLDDIDYIIL